MFLLPVVAGLAGTLLPAFGYLPAIGGRTLALEPWRALFEQPGIVRGIVLSVVTGTAATLVSFALAIGFCAFAPGRALDRIAAALTPVIATPHSALAIGLAYLLLPSGWIARALASTVADWPTPPDVATVGDPWGIALVLGLVAKETPYLLLMILAARSQVRWAELLAVCRSLGYSAPMAWLKGVLPQIYPQIRLPVYAVLAFSLSVVDMALILGPANPPTLSVLALRGFVDPDVGRYFPAAAAALLQLAIVAAAIALWRGAELAAGRIGRAWIERGGRGRRLPALRRAATLPLAALIAACGFALAGQALWSVARQWRYPDLLPAQWTLDTWARQASILATPLANSILIGVLATAIALVLVIACLENEQRRSLRVGQGALWLLYVPLLVPQIAFLFGVQVLLVGGALDGTVAATVWAHLLFVLPYLFLSLRDPWRALDPRYARAAASLGASPARTLWRVKLPLLAAPLAVACAIAFAVSIALYLPTLFAGSGRIATLTTEAVTLSSGADRRVIGVYAFVQSALPLAAYLAALLAPLLVRRNRRIRERGA